jgi:hypothetical protein
MTAGAGAVSTASSSAGVFRGRGCAVPRARPVVARAFFGRRLGSVGNGCLPEEIIETHKFHRFTAR